MPSESATGEAARRGLASPKLAAASLVVSGLLLWTVTATGDPIGESPDDESSTTTTVTASDTPTTEFAIDFVTVPDDAVDDRPDHWVQAHEPGVGGRLTGLAIDPSKPETILAAGDLLGIAISRDAGESWDSTFGLTNWEIGDITFDPNDPTRVWAGTMGGPFLSTDGGVNWEAKRSGMPAIDERSYTAPIESVLFDPTNPSRLLAIGGSQRLWVASGGDPLFGAIWESLDSGDSWTQIGTVAGGTNIMSAAIAAGSGDVVLAAILEQGVHRSTDGGRTWVSTSEGLPHNNVTDVAVHPTDPDRAWVTLGAGAKVGENHLPGGVYMTSDAGQTWQESLNGITLVSREVPGVTSRFEAIVVSPADPDRLYTGDIGYGTNIIYRSDDGGTSWQAAITQDLEVVDVFASDLTARELVAHPGDVDSFVFAHDEFIMMSTDGGVSAVDITTSKTNEDHYVGHGFSGLVATQVVFNPLVEGDVTIIGFDSANFIQSTDGLHTYRRSLRDSDPITGLDTDHGGAWRAAYGSDGERIYLLLGQPSGFRGVGRSDDGGETFTVVVGAEAGLPDYGSEPKGSGLLVDPANQDNVLIVVDNQLLRSTDGAKTFEPYGDHGLVNELAAGPGSVVYLASDRGLLLSRDGGATATLMPESPNDIEFVVFDQHTTSDVLAVSHGDNPGLYRFDGTAWEQLISASHLRQVAISPDRPDTYVVVSQDLPFHDISYATGVSITTDGGQTWAQHNDGLPLLRVSAVAFDPHLPDRIVIGTYGRGYYYSSLGGLLGESAS